EGAKRGSVALGGLGGFAIGRLAEHDDLVAPSLVLDDPTRGIDGDRLAGPRAIRHAERTRDAARPRLRRGGFVPTALLGILRPEPATVVADQLLPVIAGEATIAAIDVDDLERVGVDDADGIGGLIEDRAEARAVRAELGLLLHVVQQPGGEADADDVSDQDGQPDTAEELTRIGPDQDERRERPREHEPGHGKCVPGPQPAVAAGPRVYAAGDERRSDDAE